MDGCTEADVDKMSWQTDGYILAYIINYSAAQLYSRKRIRGYFYNEMRYMNQRFTHLLTYLQNVH